ncbi:hypothetical protein R1sor_004745 [Riccia sorocarpa]|uniref:Armadillo repeat-containing protein 2 n=1 Tax=Riccia sorocarpa TaxID=122646 RepID=A0ABD3HL32_9MARC
MDAGVVPLLVTAVEGSNRGRHCDVLVASDAVKALKSLVKYKSAMEAAIEAGFAEKAIECLSVRTLSPGLLDLLSLILDRDATAQRRKATAERIREARGVEALLEVLSVDAAGLQEKQLVAKILTRLIQLDDRVQPILRNENGMELLINLLVTQTDEMNRSSNSSCGTEVLEALIAATEDPQSLELLLNEQCIEPLLSLMSLARNSLLTELEGLALQLLLKLSRGALMSRSGADHFMVSRVSEHLVRVIGAASDDILVETAARIIRNISLFGPHERALMNAEDRGAVKILLRKIRLCQAEVPSDEVNVSVFALERFMLEDGGRRSLIKEDGISFLIKFLSKSRGQARLFATRILVMLASEHSSNDWFIDMWKHRGDLLISMRESLERGDRDTRIQAMELLRCLIRNCGGTEVCSYIMDTGCYFQLRDLQTDPECAQYANAVLATYNKTRKDQILIPTWPLVDQNI